LSAQLAPTRDEEVAFEQYLVKMKPWVKRVTGSSARGSHHPYLSQEDLIQDGLLNLWRNWRRHRHRVPAEDLGRMGTATVSRACITAYTRSRAFGGGGVRVLSLDEPLGDGARAMAETVGEDGLRTMMVQFALQEAERLLPEVERRLLHELLEPAAGTLAELRRQWTHRGRGKQTFASVREHVLAQVLEVPISRLRLAWSRVEGQVRAALDRDDPHGAPLDIVDKRQLTPNKGETTMERMGAVDQMFPMEPGMAAEAADANGADSTKVKTDEAKAKADKAAKAEKVKADKAAKAEKVKADKKAKADADKKAKAEKQAAKAAKKAKADAAKTAKVTKKPAAERSGSKEWAAKTAFERIDSGKYVPRAGEKLIPKGTEVVYLGGSRAEWLRKGDKGKVFRYYGNVGPGVRYGCRFKGRNTMIASKYVKPA